MTTRHLVDPQLAAALDFFPALPLSSETLETVRANIASFAGMIPPPDAPGVEVGEREVPGPAGAPAVRVLIYKPKADGPLPALIALHGGGYVAGTPGISDARCRVMAHQVGCLVVSVDYRLAPETPFPGAVEDCYAVLKWIAQNAAELGVDAARIGVTGDSAGGGLAASLCMLARDRGEVSIAIQALVAPMIDDRDGTGDRVNAYTGEFIWTVQASHFAWAALLGKADRDRLPAHAVPARARDLSRLPAAFIAVGSVDLFVDSNLEYARRLIGAGVPTELHVYPGGYHGFDMVAGTRLAAAFERDLVTALRQALRPAA